MTITINGDGTVTGISAGGLPDGCIQEADLAASVNTITEADQWRVTSSFSGHSSYITSNWERNDTSFDKVGTGMSESSGIFSFPSTGIWRIDYQASYSSSSDSYYCGAYIKATTNNSDYNRISYTYTSIHPPSSTWLAGIFGTVMFDVTNVTTHKIAYEVGAAAGDIAGESDIQRTGLTFTRLGDT